MRRKSVVERARQNAAASGLAERPIRWIVEDALKFCRREAKRGNRYDAVILDPPTYGHGPKGEEWQIKRDLLPLLELCGELTERRPKFVLLTCHTPGIGPAELVGVPGRRHLRPLRPAAADGRAVRSKRPTAGGCRAACSRGGRDKCESASILLQSTDYDPSAHHQPAERARQGCGQAAPSRRQRERQGRFVIDGAREILRAIDAGVEIVEAFVCEPLCLDDEARQAATQLSSTRRRVSRR